MTRAEASALIRSRALELGFQACGFADAAPVEESVVHLYDAWIAQGYAADMDYMQRNREMRFDPTLLQPGARSLIMVALNYYPREFQRGDAQFAYYAYGNDYHWVVKELLMQLYAYIQTDIAPQLMPDELLEGRAFTDSAPLLEHYWAVKAGIGFLGRNRLLIVPGCGSYCFLGALITNLPLEPSSPLTLSCGSCHRCIDACPTHAICSHEDGSCVDARKCISYQTIENRTSEIPREVAAKMGTRIYGCDECQKACPWNRFAKPTSVDLFAPKPEFLDLTVATIEAMGGGGFKRLFKTSAVQRAGYKGLLRNVREAKSVETSEE